MVHIPGHNPQAGGNVPALPEITFGPRLSSAFGEGEQERLLALLQGLSPQQFGSIQAGGSAFGRRDFQNLIQSGLISQGGGNRRFLNDLFGRAFPNMTLDLPAAGPRPANPAELNLRLGPRLGNRLDQAGTQRLFSFIQELSRLGQLPLNILGGTRGRIGLGDIQRLLDAGVGDASMQQFLNSILGGSGAHGPGGQHGGDPRFGGVGGDGPGGFTSAGQHISAPFTTPQSGMLDDLFAELLQGFRDIETLSPEAEAALEQAMLGLLNREPSQALNNDLLGTLEATISNLLEAPGLPADVMRDAENRIRETALVRERDLFRRRGEAGGDFVPLANVFGGGLDIRGRENIERGIGGQLMDALTELGLRDAMFAAQARGQGLQGALGLGALNQRGQALDLQAIGQGTQGLLGLGHLNLGEETLSSNELLRSMQLAISRELGMGELDLGQQDLELRRRLEELLLNLQIQSQFFGHGATGGTDVVDTILGDILSGFGDDFGLGDIGVP